MVHIKESSKERKKRNCWFSTHEAVEDLAHKVFMVLRGVPILTDFLQLLLKCLLGCSWEKGDGGRARLPLALPLTCSSEVQCVQPSLGAPVRMQIPRPPPATGPPPVSLRRYQCQWSSKEFRCGWYMGQSWGKPAFYQRKNPVTASSVK